MSRCRPALVLLVLVAACKKDEEPQPGPGGLVDLTEPVGVDVTGGIGQAPYAALARAVNSLGVAVPSDGMSLQVGDVTSSVTFDPTGYGSVVLQDVGTADVTGSVHPATLSAVSVDWKGVGLMPAAPPATDASTAVPATKGALVAGTSDVWWVEPGEPPHRVMEFTDGTVIDGVRSAQIDNDGVLDALVWGADTLVLLKGRPTGGLTYGAVIQAEGLGIAGASAGDANGDGLSDVTVAWLDAESGKNKLQVFEGDGLWGFEAKPDTVLAGTPIGVAAGDNTGDGTPQITVLMDDGSWQRYLYLDDEFAQTGPTLSKPLPVDSTFESGVDMNGDGGDELCFWGALNPQQDRELYIYDLLGGTPVYLELHPTEAEVSLADADADGLTDLFMLYGDQELVELSWKNAQYTQNKVASLDGHGPIAGVDLTADRVPELLMAGDVWSWWPGTTSTNNDLTWWALAEPTLASYDVDVSGPIATADLDGNPATTELVGVHEGTSGTQLEAWAVTAGASPSVDPIATIDVAGTPVAGLDVAVCGQVAWALTETALFRVDLTGGTMKTLPATATRVDCGTGPGGATAAILAGDNVELVDDNMNVLATESHPGAKDVALVTTSSGPSVGVCSTDGCSAVRWSWGDAGQEALAVGDGAGVTLTLADGTTEALAGGAGALSTADVDRDGHEDLIAASPGSLRGTRVAVFRSTGQGFGPAEIGHTSSSLTGPALFGDADGDGMPELWMQSGTKIVQAPPAL